jgi:hypothetical protein
MTAHESESILRTYLVCREKQEREREWETGKRHVGAAHSVLKTSILLPKRVSCYWGKIVLLRMLTNLRLADLCLTTAQQRSTGQNLPSNLYVCLKLTSLKVHFKCTSESRWRTGYSDCLRAWRPSGRCSSPVRVKNIHFSISFRPALGPTQPPGRSFSESKAVGAWSRPFTSN